MIVGISGNIGSGKSTVGGIIRECGYFVLDADKICHELYEKGTDVYSFIVNLFGDSILNENLSINRKALGSLMFNDESKKEELEKVVHFAILNELKARSNSMDDSLIFWEVPLLFEAGFDKEVDRVIYVTSDMDTMISRVKERDTLSEDKIKERLKYQKNWMDNLREEDFLIINNGSLDDLKNRITFILEQINHCL